MNKSYILNVGNRYLLFGVHRVCALLVCCTLWTKNRNAYLGNYVTQFVETKYMLCHRIHLVPQKVQVVLCDTIVGIIVTSMHKCVLYLNLYLSHIKDAICKRLITQEPVML